jgi:hypothetical protein
LSIDPTIRDWMAMDTYLPAIEIGEPIRSGGLGTVIESNSDSFLVGSTVFGMTGWRQYALFDGGSQVVPDGIEPEAALSVFGVTGLTAYFGLLDVGRPVAGETVLLSGAAGATGSIVGQIAHRRTGRRGDQLPDRSRVGQRRPGGWGPLSCGWWSPVRRTRSGHVCWRVVRGSACSLATRDAWSCSSTTGWMTWSRLG